MTILLRVLIVEDSEDDTQLMLRQLRSGGYDPRWERVDTPEAMSSALDREQWDVILCDYRMPRFSAPAALKLVQERGSDIPFIIVSGTIGENAAVDSMKSGAHDYLMKNNLARLVVAIEREMREASTRHEKRKTEDELQRSEQSFKAVTENAHDGMIVALRNGSCIYVNKRATAIMGYHINEILKTGIEGFARPDERLKLSERRNKILAGENVPNQYETVIIHKNGNAVPIEITSARTLWYGQTADIFIFRDITERKKAEEALRESEERFRTIVENAPFGYYRVGKDGLWQYVNPVWERMHSLSLEEVIGKPFEITQPEESVEQARELIKRVLAGETIEGEFGRLMKDGSIGYHSFNIQPVKHSKEIVAIEGFINDITERKRAEEALRESEERFRIAAESTSDCVWEWNIEKGSLDWFGDVDSLLGYRKDEFPRTIDAWENAVHPEDRDQVMALLDKHFADNTPYSAKYRIVKKDGSIAFWAGRGTALRDENGKAYKMIGSVKDITEQKKAEEALKKQAQLLMDTGEMAKVGGWELDVETREQVWTEEVYRIHEVDMNYKPTVSGGIDFYAPASRPIIERAVQRVIEHGEPFDVELEFITAKGNLRWVHATGKINQEHSKVLGAFQDITERKKAEEELKKAKVRLDLAIDASQLGIWELDLIKDSSIRDLRHDQIFGYEEKLAEWGAKIFFEHIIAEDRPSVQAAFDRAMETDRLYFECRILWPDKSIHWITATGKTVRDSAGKPQEMFGTVTDITEQKKAEEKIRSQLDELKRWQNVMLGREDRVQELKREVNELYGRMGQAVRYASQKDAPADPGAGIKEHK